RLLLETVPTRPTPATPWGYWTEAQQDDHWNTLCEAVDTPNAKRPAVRCTGCGLPLDRTWTAQGHRHHATCTPRPAHHQEQT
ncbi:hypothetical protein, partial [Streptomyces sp. A012304]|uniref:hypothetical protein n=1 Tax=Streptomyces sp. A012304 TaxID=375446 RepID=UPI0022326DB9